VTVSSELILEKAQKWTYVYPIVDGPAHGRWKYVGRWVPVIGLKLVTWVSGRLA